MVPRMKNGISAVILAGGMSRRMGQPKGLLPLGRRSFLSHLVRVLAPFADRVVVVTGAHRYAMHNAPGTVQFVHAHHWRLGMRASLATGLSACDDGWILLTHIDRPFVQPNTIARIIDARDSRVVVPIYAGQYGHPILIPPALRSRLSTVEDVPLNRLVLNNRTCGIAVADPGVIMNLNHPSDYGLATTVFGKFSLSACIETKGA